jgi:dihydrofolate reductase
MIISLVVAMAENRVIGRDNGLPWRLSTDLRRFKALTIGKPVVMGRKCYESIGKPLPGRPNIVITRNPDFTADGVIVAHSLDHALDRAEDEAKAIGTDEICVIGGGEIYRQAIDDADVLHVTHVLADPEGDAYFPEIDPEIWEADHQEDIPKGEKDDFATRFVIYRRKQFGLTG